MPDQNEQCKGCTYQRANGHCRLGFQGRFTYGCWRPDTRPKVVTPPLSTWVSEKDVEAKGDGKA